MRTLAIGDIHGCYTALTTLAELVGFSRDDRIVLLGDYIDRGPDSERVLDWIIKQSLRGDVIALRGNHEVMMLGARTDATQFRAWLSFGGDEALRSYGIDDFHGPWKDDIPSDHWDFLLSTQLFFETDSHIFVHATAVHNVNMADQTADALFWRFFDSISPHQSGKTIVCGHSSQKSGEIAAKDHAICIDTWACGLGWLTCLDVDSLQYWQANQNGESQLGLLNRT